MSVYVEHLKWRYVLSACPDIPVCEQFYWVSPVGAWWILKVGLVRWRQGMVVNSVGTQAGGKIYKKRTFGELISEMVCIFHDEKVGNVSFDRTEVNMSKKKRSES